MKLYTAQWEENGRAGRRSFTIKRLAIEFGREKVQAVDCSPVSVWSYAGEGPVAHMLAIAHDRGDWWKTRKYEGTVLKSGAWTKR